MEEFKKINITTLRKKLFNIADESLDKRTNYVIDKSGRPVFYLIAAGSPAANKIVKTKEEYLRVLKRIENFRKMHKKTSDSVKLLRELRKSG